jgi:AhpD family alkylhydroperoxidase
MDHFEPTVEAMTKRISLNRAAHDVYRAIDALDASVDFDPALRELVRIRASQQNGCSYCVDYHSVDAKAAGEDDRRIWAVAAWRDNPLFDDRERAALALTDALTRLPDGGVPDDVYAEAARHFDEAELGNLMGAIIAINAWNRVGVGTKLAPELEPAAA